jgi:hypothetical protein
MPGMGRSTANTKRACIALELFISVTALLNLKLSRYAID